MNTFLNHPRFLTILMVITLGLHLIIASFTPLTVDEAHYALYGQRPALSYFDHPPLIGWLQMFALLLGEHELILRLWPIALYALSLLLLHRFTQYHFQHIATANLAALLFAIMPMTFVLGVGFVPESLLMPLTIALFWQARHTLLNPLWRNWMFLGGLIGLAGLSKYTAVTMALGLILMLWVSNEMRWLLRPQLWLSIGIAGLMMTPILIWNAQHDWISFTYQLNHGAPETPWLGSHLIESQLSQLLSYTPWVWFGAWWAMLTIWQHKADLHYRQLWAFLLPGLFLFTLLSGKEPSLPHWLLFFYTLWLPFLSQRMVHGFDTASPKRWWVIGNMTLGALLVMASLILSLFPKLGEHLTPNPAADFMGWKATAMAAKEQAQANEVLLVTHWVDASRIAWYARPQPVIVLDQRTDQFDLWYGSPQQGMSGILIQTPDMNPAWLTAFAHCTPLTSHAPFALFRCQEWTGQGF